MIERVLLIGWGASCLLCFCCFGWDKAAAVRGARRVPERRLLTLALLGGAGALLGMIGFRHKTRKLRFWAAAWTGTALGVAAVWAWVLR